MQNPPKDMLTASKTDKQTVQPLAPLMRGWFYADMVLVFVAGVQLFVLSELTNQFFAWTIKSSLTAAFLGAAYLSTLPMLWNSARERVWANARIAVPGVWVFTVLTFIATLQHWDKFHWNNPLFTAQFAFWVWLAIYVLVPVTLVVVYFIQRRVPGVEPARVAPIQTVMRIAIGAQAIVMLLLGAAMFLGANAVAPLWAWALTPLTSAAVGAWFIGTGVTGLWSLYENDWRRIRAAMLTYALLGILQFVAAARFFAQIDFSKSSAILYLAFMLSIVLVGGLGVYCAKRAGAFEKE